MKKLRVKQAYQKVMIDYNVNVLTTDYGSFRFDNITFDYSKYNLFQIVELYINNEVVTTLFLMKKINLKYCIRMNLLSVIAIAI